MEKSKLLSAYLAAEQSYRIANEEAIERMDELKEIRKEILSTPELLEYLRKPGVLISGDKVLYAECGNLKVSTLMTPKCVWEIEKELKEIEK